MKDKEPKKRQFKKNFKRYCLIIKKMSEILTYGKAVLKTKGK